MPIEDAKLDWNTLYCPNKCCRYYGIPFQLGKLVKNGSTHGQRQALCRSCGGGVALSYATAYYGLESGQAIFETAVRALAEGNSIRATGRILQIDKDTVCDWLDRAALHCRSVALYFWTGLHVTECQLDVNQRPKLSRDFHFSASNFFQLEGLVRGSDWPVFAA